MPRCIDADALIDFLDVGHLRHPSELCFSEIDVANLLLHAPTISPDEVRGVVHCRDCRYAEHRCPVGIKTEIFCKLFGAGMKAHDYCSYGAKMEVSEDA